MTTDISSANNQKQSSQRQIVTKIAPVDGTGSEPVAQNSARQAPDRKRPLAGGSGPVASEPPPARETSPRNLPTRGQICDNKTRPKSDQNSTSSLAARNTKRRLANNRQRQSIDSRSILNNKEKLKRFWETKMELELRQRSQRREPIRRSSLPTGAGATKGASDEIAGAARGERPALVAPASESKMIISLEDLDENNNNNNNDDGDADGPFADRARAEPISAELLCEKLHAVKRRLRLDQLEECKQEACAKVEAQPMSINPTLCHSRETRGQSEVQLEANELESELEQESEEQSANEEFSSSNSSFGPMSISVAKTTTTTTTILMNSQQDFAAAEAKIRHDENAPRSGLVAADSLAGDPNTGSDLDEADREEDDDDENSTQSGSVLTVINGNGGAQEPTSSTTNERDAHDDQSGDLPPPPLPMGLITSIEDDDQEEDCRPIGSDQDQVQDQGQDDGTDGTDIGVAFESLQFDDEIKSSKNELVDEERLLANDQRKKTPPSWRTASNCNKSVAWPRDAGQLKGDGATANCRPMPKFSSREVKSVCSLIASAVTDASKQVDDYIKSKACRSDGRADEPTAGGNDDDDDDDEHKGHEVGGEREHTTAARHRFSLADEGFQRAKFVRRDGSPPPPPPTKATANRPLVGSIGSQCTGSNEIGAIGASGKSNRHQNEPPPTGLNDDELLGPEVELEQNCGRNGVDDDDDDQLDLEELGDDMASLELANGLDPTTTPPPPRTDLSSIFEANVRREIKRFESNAAQQDSGQLTANSIGGYGGGQQNTLLTPTRFGLTEWRIAEEIRQFNERENELKQRSNRQLQMAPPVSNDTSSSQQKIGESAARTVDQLKQRGPGDDSNQSSGVQFGRSIKLSSSVTFQPSGHLNNAKSQQQPPTMISMHKFISSGGRRFVYKQSSNCSLALGNATSQQLESNNFNGAHHQRLGQLTKSMSNLSSLTGGGGSSSSALSCAPAPRPVVDYRAVDSLRCKEVPNVKPGLARQTIETFSRLATSGSGSLTGLDVGGNASTAAFLPQIRPVAANSSARQNCPSTKTSPNLVHMQKGSASSICSAEWKIQEELREMKAREAELRDLRSQQRQQVTANKPLANADHDHDHDAECAPATTTTTTKLAGENELQINNKITGPRRTRTQSVNCQPGQEESGEWVRPESRNEHADLVVAGQVVARLASGRSSSASGAGPVWDDEQSAEPEPDTAHSLFPIKQTIDSFRKLNASVGATNNNNQPLHQRRQVSVTHQMKRA